MHTSIIAAFHNGGFGGVVSMMIEADGFRKDDSGIATSLLYEMTPLRKCNAGNAVSDVAVRCSLFAVHCSLFTVMQLRTKK